MEDSAVVDFITSNQDGKVTVTVPQYESIDQIETFVDTLQGHVHQHGVKKLVERLRACVRNRRVAERQYGDALTAARAVNGIRYRTAADPHTALRRAARKYFNTLVDGPKGTEALRTQCKLFKIDYESYDTMEDIVAALVEAQVNMQ